MSDREKPPAAVGGAPPIDPELLAYLNGPPPQDENGVDLSLIREGLAMTVEERSEWHYRARQFAESLQAMGRQLRGPVRDDAQAAG